MDVLSCLEMVAREKEAFASGTTAEALMNAAGEAMARRVSEIYPRADEYLILVGKGNNGGDGLVVARHLVVAGKKVRVVLTAPGDQLGELPVMQLRRLHDSFPETEVGAWHGDLEFPSSTGVVIDALLGIQAKGALRGVVADIVVKLNAARAVRFFRTVALDLPSGLSAYEETAAPKDKRAAVVADITLAVGFAKNCLARESLSAWVGRLEVVPWSNSEKTMSPRQLLVPSELANILPRRSAFSYKGNFGKLAIISGSRGFTGAAILCTQAAQAVGVGLLSVCTHDDAAPIIAAHAPPEAMVSGWGKLDATPGVVEKASAIVIGPGLGATSDTEKMLRAVLAVGCPVLIDADGLNVLAKNLDLLKTAKGPVVLTPHVGEMARLIGRKFEPDERETVALDFVEKHKNVTLVLKGTRTLVTAAGKQLFINGAGNPGLSTGGSGDTLSGIIGGLLAQGLAPLDVARLGVWWHGHAADLALADRGCEEGLTPTMLSAHLGAALVSLRAQAVPETGLLERSRT
jgi:NAD(P)H-hydrate epimerase